MTPTTIPSRAVRRAHRALPIAFDTRSVVLFAGLALGAALASHAQMGPDGRANMPLSVTAPAGASGALRSQAAAGGLVPPSVAAQPGLAPVAAAGTGTAKPDVPTIFGRADADRDGRLSRTEAERLPDLARNFDRVDSDHDGAVSLPELQAAVGH